MSGSSNPFQPASLQHRFALMPANAASKRAADSGIEEIAAKRNASQLFNEADVEDYEEEDEADMPDFVQDCAVCDCEHVVVYVGEPSVKFTLCKTPLQHQSEYFRVALDSRSSFKEGQDLSINLKDVGPEDFLLYINSIFPTRAADYEPVPMTKCIIDKGGERVTVTALLHLFHSIDRFGSLSCSHVKQRVLKSMRILSEIAPKMSWCQAEKMRFLKGFSIYNMDQDRDFFEELLKIDFIIDDLDIMKEVKPSILHPIMAKAVTKLNRKNYELKRENRKLEDVIDSPTSVEMYCVPCNKPLPLGNSQTLSVGRPLVCPNCNTNFIIRRKQKPQA